MADPRPTPGYDTAPPPPVDYEQLFRVSPNPYMLLDRSLCYVDANEAYVRVVGQPLSKLRGRNLFDVFPHDPGDPANTPAAMLRASLQRVLDTRAADHLALIEYRVPVPGAPDEGSRFWSATHTPLLDADGEVTFILQHTVDVTELHRLAQGLPAAGTPVPSAQMQAGLLTRASLVQEVNQLLAKERRQLLRMFEQAPGFVTFLRGPEHVFELANEAYLQLVGRRDILGRPLREALPELRGQGFDELLDRVYSSGTPYVGRQVRATLQRTPGAPPDEIVLDFVYQPIHGADGATTGILVQGQDMTEQTRALAEREEFLRVVEQASDMIGFAALDGIARYLNPAGMALLGLRDLEEVRRTRVIDCFVAEDQPRVLAEAIPAALAGGEWTGDLRLRNFQTGATTHVRYKIFPIKDAAGRAVALATVTTDITERMEAEAELRRRADFEQQLIGIVSHDLRNPLSAILLGATSLLHRQELDERAVKTVTRILDATQRATRMVRDLLDFTQARLGGGIPVIRGPADLHDLARQVVDEAAMIHPERELVLRQEGDGHGEWDADRVAQLLTNLVTNAAKYGRPGSPVTVTSRGVEQEVELCVHNQGSAIPPEVQARLFQPMQRGTAQGAETTRSVGLGLFIVKKLAEAHGGEVTVESTEQAGTTFRVRLPRRAR